MIENNLKETIYTSIPVREITTDRVYRLTQQEKEDIKKKGIAVQSYDGISTYEMVLNCPHFEKEKRAQISQERWEQSRAQIVQKEALKQNKRGIFLSPTAMTWIPKGIYELNGQELHKTRGVVSDSMNEIIIGDYASMAVLTGALVEAGNDIKSIETRYNKVIGMLDEEDIKDIQNAEFVCVTSTGFEEPSVLRMLWQLRSIAPHVPVILGGWGPSTEINPKFDKARHIVPEKFVPYIENGLVDLILLGDGAQSLPQAVNALLNTQEKGRASIDILKEQQMLGNFAGGALLLNKDNQVEKIGEFQQKMVTEKVIGAAPKTYLKSTPMATYEYHKYDRRKVRTLAENPSALRGLVLMEKMYGPEVAQMWRTLFAFIDSRNWTDMPTQEGCQHSCSFCSQPFMNGRGSYPTHEQRMKIYDQMGKWMKDGHYLTGNNKNLNFLKYFGININEISPLSVIFLSGDNLIANPFEFINICLEKWTYFDFGKEKSPNLCAQFTTNRMNPELVLVDDVEKNKVDATRPQVFIRTGGDIYNIGGGENKDDKFYFIPLNAQEADILGADRNAQVIKVKKELYDRARLQGAVMELSQFLVAAFGFESGDIKALDAYNKNTGVLDALISMRALHEGMTVSELLSCEALLKTRIPVWSQELKKAFTFLATLDPNKRIAWKGLIQAFTMVSPNNKENDRATEKMINYFNAVAQRIPLQEVNHFPPRAFFEQVAKTYEERDQGLEWFKYEFAALGLDAATGEQGNQAHMLGEFNFLLQQQGSHMYDVDTAKWVEMMRDPEFIKAYHDFVDRTTDTLHRLNNFPEAAKVSARALMQGTSPWGALSRVWTSLIYLPLRAYQQRQIQEALANEVVYARMADQSFMPILKNN